MKKYDADQSSTPGTCQASMRPVNTPENDDDVTFFLSASSDEGFKSGASSPGGASSAFSASSAPRASARRSGTPNPRMSVITARYAATTKNTSVHRRPPPGCAKSSDSAFVIASPPRSALAEAPAPRFAASNTNVATLRPTMSPAAPVVDHRPRMSPRWLGSTHPEVTATRLGNPRDWTRPLRAHRGTYSATPWVHASVSSRGRGQSHPSDSAPKIAITAAVPARPTMAAFLLPYLAPTEPLKRRPTPYVTRKVVSRMPRSCVGKCSRRWKSPFTATYASREAWNEAHATYVMITLACLWKPGGGGGMEDASSIATGARATRRRGGGGARTRAGRGDDALLRRRNESTAREKDGAPPADPRDARPSRRPARPEKTTPATREPPEAFADACERARTRLRVVRRRGEWPRGSRTRT